MNIALTAHHPASPNPPKPAGLPTIPTLDAGLAHLAALPLANPAQARHDLAVLLDSLRHAPLPAADYLTLLEQGRIAFTYLQEEMARIFTDRAVPLGEREQEVLAWVAGDWHRLANAYAHCAQVAPADDPLSPQQLALILQRCLYCTGHALYDHYRARREAPPGLWLDLHGYYASAEEWGVASLPVDEPLDPGRGSTHATATYVEALLLDLAAPYGLDLRALAFVRRLASRWAPLVQIAAVEAEAPPRFAIDLFTDAGVRPLADGQSGTGLRRLDVGRLTAQLQQTQVQLAQRVQPAQLGLGDNMMADRCAHLIGQLNRPWSLTAAPRRFRRLPASGEARVCRGGDAIFRLLAGRTFIQPATTAVYSRGEFERLYMFRQQAEPAAGLAGTAHHDTQPTETWQVINHSAAGFRLNRSRAGLRLNHDQLLAVVPPDGAHCLLGRTSWLMEDRDGGLVLGVAVLPGLPTAVALRPVPSGGHRDPYQPGFLLAGLPALDQAASLVIPKGWYVTGRHLEVAADDGQWRIKLSRLLEQGGDFERVSFTAAE